MDIYCPKCSEPFDTGEFEFVAEEQGVTMREATRNFLRDGCSTVGMACPGTGGMRGEATAALADECGDDTDAVASMLDDMIYVGLVS